MVWWCTIEQMRHVSMELEILGRHQHPDLTLPFLKVCHKLHPNPCLSLFMYVRRFFPFNLKLFSHFLIKWILFWYPPHSLLVFFKVGLDPWWKFLLGSTVHSSCIAVYVLHALATVVDLNVGYEFTWQTTNDMQYKSWSVFRDYCWLSSNC